MQKGPKSALMQGILLVITCGGLPLRPLGSDEKITFWFTMCHKNSHELLYRRITWNQLSVGERVTELTIESYDYSLHFIVNCINSIRFLLVI